MELKIDQILQRFPFRVAITDYCNAQCFFCSNEGMPCERRNTENIDVEGFSYLVEVLSQKGLGQISLTGGDPTLHPQLDAILGIVNSTNVAQRYFHTNGIELGRALDTGELDGFDKIAVSIHAVDYGVWSRITRGTKEQYNHLISGLRTLKQRRLGKKVEIKHVPMQWINDSDYLLKETLDLCAENGFRFKFLNFEPIEQAQRRLVVPIDRLAQKLENLGCEPQENMHAFRGQSDYLPIRSYSYKGTKGVAIEIGCGDSDVCKACYKSNEIFLTPRLEIKPCHADTHVIPLMQFIQERDQKEILKRIVESREYLYRRPGESIEYWRQKIA